MLTTQKALELRNVFVIADGCKVRPAYVIAVQNAKDGPAAVVSWTDSGEAQTVSRILLEDAYEIETDAKRYAHRLAAAMARGYEADAERYAKQAEKLFRELFPLLPSDPSPVHVMNDAELLAAITAPLPPVFTTHAADAPTINFQDIKAANEKLDELNRLDRQTFEDMKFQRALNGLIESMTPVGQIPARFIFGEPSTANYAAAKAAAPVYDEPGSPEYERKAAAWIDELEARMASEPAAAKDPPGFEDDDREAIQPGDAHLYGTQRGSVEVARYALDEAAKLERDARELGEAELAAADDESAEEDPIPF